MKIAVLTSSISRLAGGLFYSVRALSTELSTSGHDVAVFSLEDTHAEEDKSQWGDLQVCTSPVVGPGAFGYSPGLAADVKAFAPDVIHVHGLWQFISCVARQNLSARGVPYLMSPRGMLDPWAVNNSGLKKKLAAFLYERRNLHAAACMHALNKNEAQSIRQYGLSQPVCVVPNGVNLPPASDQIEPGRSADKRRILFLGRIHPKKGICELLQAWARVRAEFTALSEEWELVIAGWDDGGHLEELRTTAKELGVGESVSFPGSFYGEEKTALLQTADWFVLPSFSEGMPMAVLEAWSYGIPSITSPACNLPEGFSSGASLSVDPEANSICDSLLRVFGMPVAEQKRMGSAARSLVEERFTWEQIAKEMSEVYQWMLEGGSPSEQIFR